MSESDEEVERLLKSIRDTSPNKLVRDARPEPLPAPPSQPDPRPEPQPQYRMTTPADAIARCRDAWKQAYDAYTEKNVRKDGSMLETYAEKAAAAAFRAAMPELATWCGIRDFIACVAYGILIDAIPSERTGQLLYAAQTALALLPRIPPL